MKKTENENLFIKIIMIDYLVMYKNLRVSTSIRSNDTNIRCDPQGYPTVPMFHCRATVLPWGGGGCQVQGGRTHVTHFAEEGDFLKTSACPRCAKEGYFFVSRYEVWGVKIPVQSTKYPRL